MKHTATESYTESVLPVHPAAMLLPILPEGSPEDQALVASIREQGQLESIKTIDGQLLDGRARLRACRKLGREPWIEALSEATDPFDPFAYVLGVNLHRYHRSEAQKAMIALDMAKASGKTHAEAALACGVRKQAVERIAFAANHAPEVLEMIQTGRVKSPWRAREIAKMTPEERRREPELMFAAAENTPKPRDQRGAARYLNSLSDRDLTNLAARGFSAILPANAIRARLAKVIGGL